jgi:hypothetical protein
VREFNVYVLALVVFALAAPANAIVINASDDAGIAFDGIAVAGNVGTVANGGLTVVYLGEGWVLTASHVGARDVEIGERVYRKSSDAVVQIYNDDRTEADLIAFRILGNPDLPDLPPLTISEETPSKGAFAILAGAGREKGRENRSLGGVLRRIWRGRTAAGPRWGTNTIAESSERVAIGDWVTAAISTDYSTVDDLFATPYEAQAVSGDSGGALFIADGNDYVLAGVLFAVSTGDPYGHKPSRTFAVDLAHYREQILAAIEAEATDPPRAGASSARTRSAPNVGTWIAATTGAAIAIVFAFYTRRTRARREPL